MRKFLTSILEKLIKKLKDEEPKIVALEKAVVEEAALQNKEENRKTKQKKKINAIAPYKENPARDLIEMMEVPFLALSKNRKNPIIYESEDGTRKVKITRHTGHFLASIYDWDIILFVASKMQEILNKGRDIPPRTLVVPRHEILKSLHKYDGKKQQKDLESSLSRLKLTGIDTTIRNEDFRYRAGFGFLDSWGYTERKDIKEIHITLSQWLYDGICAKGALLKVDPAYFDLTSALKRFLYRTARKHVGNSDEPWEFSIKKLYKKSGSEREFRKFKSDLKAVVIANDIPGYTIQWVQKIKKESVLFKRLSKLEKLERIAEGINQKIENE
jgi:plasmid replication initiation protein